MSATWSAFAPGKLILCGEHAVVYGQPAIAVAVDRGTTVTLVDRPGPSGVDEAPFADDRLGIALATLLPEEGVGVRIESTLPVGRGMGSSAALAVALVRALAAREGRAAPFEECMERGFRVERVFHGTPSGVDHTVSALGGAVRYRKLLSGPEIRPIPAPPLRLVVLDSGEAGDTARLVAGVAARRPAVDPVIAAIGTLVDRVAGLLAAPSPDLGAVGRLLTENHQMLRRLGVSTPRLDALVGLALRSGALGAKLAGAGGGGVVVALVDHPEPVLEAAAAAAAHAFEATIAPRTG